MKSFICHNTSLVDKGGWPTSDKKGEVIIYDENNLFAFVIDFGKSPRVRIWKTKKNGDFIKFAVKDTNNQLV